ncbi:von Hippel-Lindau disease tumor suppressor beta domain [Trinorchestia longiramus]|nr:von Hippel-Lindau disease tumor suppressor beta domain [Trinorchestia longiramus]
MEYNHDEQNNVDNAVADAPAAINNALHQEIPARLGHAQPAARAAPEPQPLRAVSTDRPSFVTFRNCTDRLVDVYWFDYQGNSVLYKTLPAQGRLSVNTYETHPWSFVDHHSRARLVVNHARVFFPRHYAEDLGVDAVNDVTPLHRTVDITIPIFTLKDCAIQALLKSVGDIAQLRCLQLPGTLLNDVLAAATGTAA